MSMHKKADDILYTTTTTVQAYQQSIVSVCIFLLLDGAADGSCLVLATIAAHAYRP